MHISTLLWLLLISAACGEAARNPSVGSEAGVPDEADDGGSRATDASAANASERDGSTASAGDASSGDAAPSDAATGTTTGTRGNDGGNADSGSAPASGAVTGGGTGFYQMERLDRGLVAVATERGNYVGFRMLGFEYDSKNPSAVSYDLYRDGKKLASITDSTNYQDASGTTQSKYAVRAILAGSEGELSASAGVWAQNYLRIPLSPPSNAYSANDGSVGDADGDGVYEIYLKWDPNDAKDNSQPGVTSNVLIDALKLDGTRLFRIDLGPNIRAGAHYTQFVVYDFDGDGKAELAVKTAPGTKDGMGHLLALGPAANDDDAAIHRNAEGYVLSGPEYLTVFDGQTGAERATVNFDVARGSVAAWGDDYGNRVDRFLGTAAYLDGTGLASFVMARGYYTRTTLVAWNFRAGKITQLWKFDSNVTPKDAAGHPYTGQGSHSMAVADVDDDPGQEIMYGAMAIDHDGKGLCSTGLNHGDAEHVGDLVPSRPGLELFMCNEDGAHPAYHLRDAKTCAILQQGPINGADTGRCAADDVSATSPGAEMWASSVEGFFSATTQANVGEKPSYQNFLIYWDADESRELEDKTSVAKYGGGTLVSCASCAANNGTKATPVLTADLLGDWREEIIWREADNSALRLYTTTDVTARRIYTLMHDPQYRMQVVGEQTAYNQPPHTSFHIGSGMATPPVPNIKVR